MYFKKASIFKMNMNIMNEQLYLLANDVQHFHSPDAIRNR